MALVEKEVTLKAAFNAYIDALVDMMDELKAGDVDTEFNHHVRDAYTKYLLDHNIDVASVVMPSRNLFMALDTEQMLARKVL